MKARSAAKSGPGRMHSRPKTRRKDKKFAAEHKIPETLRRYAKRFGVDVITVQQIQLQNKEAQHEITKQGI